MKTIALILLSLVSLSLSINRDAAVAYAYKYVSTPNHQCGNPWKCRPWGYYGSEACGYRGEGGDCANFVSQCILAGGHSPLNENIGSVCRGYPCGKEEIGAAKLGDCLKKVKGHRSECGRNLKPPSWVKKGDVLIYRAGSCSGGNAHAVLVTKVEGGNAYITCHSSIQKDKIYTYMSGKPYYQWISMG